jgi:hypothetical protein
MPRSVAASTAAFAPVTTDVIACAATGRGRGGVFRAGSRVNGFEPPQGTGHKPGARPGGSPDPIAGRPPRIAPGAPQRP